MRQVHILNYVVIAGVVLGSPAWGQEPGDESVQTRLEQTLVDVDFDDVSLAKVIESFRSRHGLNIYVHERALQAGGIELSTPITLRLEQVPLSTALRLALRGASDTVPITYAVENQVVIISTGDDTTAPPVLRLYDVADLISSGFSQRRLLNTPLLRLRLTGSEAQGAEVEAGKRAGGGDSIFGNGDDEGPFGPGVYAGATFERLQELIDLIRETVAPDTWRENGGRGSIVRQGSRLVVTNTPAAHDQIKVLLDLLRSDPPPVIDLHVALFRAPPGTLDRLQLELAEIWPRLSSSQAAALEADLSAKGTALLKMTTTGPSGQSQVISTLTQQEYVAATKAVVATEAVGYEPIIEPANSGLEVIVLPPDGQSLTLDVSMALTTRSGVSQETFARGENNEALSVQLRSGCLQTLLSKVQLGLGQGAVLAVPPARIPEVAEERGPDVLLLLQPMVRGQR